MAKRVCADSLRQAHKDTVDDMMKTRETWGQLQRETAIRMQKYEMAEMMRTREKTDSRRGAIDHVKKALLDGSVTTDDIAIYEAFARVSEMLKTCSYTVVNYPKSIVDQAIAEAEIAKMIESE